MNRKTLKALQGSIQKWVNILRGVGEDHGRDNCPLCIEFFDNDCQGCPVRDAVNRIQCHGTPYREWIKHIEQIHDENHKIISCKVCSRHAYDELEFLRSLLP